MTSWKRSRWASAFSSPRSFGISTESETSSGTSIRSSTSAPSASCGITSARTKLVTSSRLRPVRASSSISRTFSSVGTISGSFWNPSRGPTSRMATRTAPDSRLAGSELLPRRVSERGQRRRTILTGAVRSPPKQGVAKTRSSQLTFTEGGTGERHSALEARRARRGHGHALRARGRPRNAADTADVRRARARRRRRTGVSGADAGTAGLQRGVGGRPSPAFRRTRNNVELVGKVELTQPFGDVRPEQIADVSAKGDYAYLNSWQSPVARPGAPAGSCERGGVFVVDISDPANPRQVTFDPVVASAPIRARAARSSRSTRRRSRATC